MALSLLLFAAFPQDPSVMPAGARIDDYAPAPWSPSRDSERAPFASRASPDHVVVLVGDDVRRERWTIRRHGDWAHVEDSDAHGTSVWLASLRDPVALSFSRGPDGRYDRLFIRLNQAWGDAPPPIRPTGAHDRLLGESCAVWDVTARVANGAGDSRWLSCVTDDGIELWRRYEAARGYRREWRAISLSREPVPAALVTPPDDLLDPDRWAIDWPDAGDDSIETSMTQEAAGPFRRHARYRRAGAVTRLDQPFRLIISDRATGAALSFSRHPDGRYDHFSFSAPQEGDLSFGPPEPADPERFPPITFAGERCVWSHMTPGIHDYARWECLTSEGDLMAQRTQTRGSGADFRPVAVSRGTLAPSDVRPPAEVIDPANWGLD